jgi:hypothetical protein
LHFVSRIRLVAGKLKFFKPSESENLTNLFCKSDSQTLRAGFELHPPEIICAGLGGRLAEYRQKSAGKQAKN